MILLPKLRLGVSAFSGPECMQEISSLGVRYANIPVSMLDAGNAAAFRESAENHKIIIDAVCTNSPGYTELATAVGAQTICISSNDIQTVIDISAAAKSAGIKYMIWEPAGMNTEDCKRMLADVAKASAIPVKLAIEMGSGDACEKCRILGKDAMIVIRNKDNLQMLGKAIDSLRAGGSRENMIVLDMPTADLAQSVSHCRNFVRE